MGSREVEPLLLVVEGCISPSSVLSIVDSLRSSPRLPFTIYDYRSLLSASSYIRGLHS